MDGFKEKTGLEVKEIKKKIHKKTLCGVVKHKSVIDRLVSICKAHCIL